MSQAGPLPSEVFGGLRRVLKRFLLARVLPTFRAVLRQRATEAGGRPARWVDVFAASLGLLMGKDSSIVAWEGKTPPSSETGPLVHFWDGVQRLRSTWRPC